AGGAGLPRPALAEQLPDLPAVRAVRRAVERRRVPRRRGTDGRPAGRAAGRRATGRSARVGADPAGPGRSAGTGLAVAATRSRLAPGWCDDRIVNLVTLADIEAARKLIDGVVRYTPLEPSRPLTELLDGPAWL